MRDDDGLGFGGIAAIGGTVLVVVVGVPIIFGSWFTVDQTERGVLLRNGAISEIVQPGLHFKTPWIESVAKIDMQTHTLTVGQDGKNVTPMEAYSADQQPAQLRVSVTYHVAPDKVADLYSRFGGDVQAGVSRIITPHVYERVKDVFGQYSAQRAITDRVKLNVDAGQAIKDSIAYDPVFVIESAQIENIEFSKEYINSIEARMQAEVKVQQKQQELAQQEIDAKIAVTQATGRANSVRAEAEANAAKTVMLGNAEATAIKARADALGSNPNLIALTQAEKWDGHLPTTMIPGSTVPFLNIAPVK